jgi:hypothetical protein
MSFRSGCVRHRDVISTESYTRRVRQSEKRQTLSRVEIEEPLAKLGYGRCASSNDVGRPMRYVRK